MNYLTMKGNKLISLENVSQEDLRKWQLGLLDILVYFRDFCNEHGLVFYLAGGTRLGAIRHHGFIPWDDDVDVQMFRKDYDRLIEIWNKEADTSRFVCQVSNERMCSRFPMATIRSVNTTCIFDHSVKDDFCHGLKIDVEFLDVVPKERWKKKLHTYFCLILALYRAQRIPRRASRRVKNIAAFLLAICPSRFLRWKVSNWCEKRIKQYNPPTDSDIVSYLMVAPYKMEWFKDTKWVNFEGYEMPVPSGYDQILSAQYGDYMQLPPVDKRTPVTDNLVYYDLNHSYIDYKGKYYCVKKSH